MVGLSNRYNPATLAEDYIPEDELMGGRRYVRSAYGVSGNARQRGFWVNYLTSLAISSIEWEGLPASIDARAVEYILLHFGCGALFTESGGHLFAQAAPADNVNMYYNPNKINLYTPNGDFYTRHCNIWVDGGEVMPRDAVACFDNMTRSPLVHWIRLYAARLAQFDRVIDVNVGAQRTPWMLRAPEESKGSVKAMQRRLAANDQFIPVNDAADGIIGAEVLQTNAPYVVDKLMADKKKLLDEATTLLGVDNANTEKKERVNTQEVLSNNEQIAVMRQSRMKCREEFCETANVVFGLDLSVRWAVPHAFELVGTNDEGDHIDAAQFMNRVGLGSQVGDTL